MWNYDYNKVKPKEEGMWCFRIRSSFNQLEVKLIYMKNGEKISLV